MSAWSWLLVGSLAGALFGHARVSSAAPPPKEARAKTLDPAVVTWLRSPLAHPAWERAVSDHYRPIDSNERWNHVRVPLGLSGSKTLVVRGLVDERPGWDGLIRHPRIHVEDRETGTEVPADAGDLATFGIHDARGLAARLRKIVATAPSKPGKFEQRVALLERISEDPAGNLDQLLLGEYVRSAGARYIDLTTDGEMRIAIDPEGRLFRRRASDWKERDSARPYTPWAEDRLTALAADAAGVTTKAGLDALLAKKVAELTRTASAHHRGPKPTGSTPAAQQQLRSMAAEHIEEVARFMAHVTKSPDLMLLSEHNASATYEYIASHGMPPRQAVKMQPLFFNDESTPTTLIVDHDTLRVAPTDDRSKLMLAPIRGNRSRWYASGHYDPLSAPAATQPELHALELGTIESFDRYLAHRMLLASGKQGTKEPTLLEARTLLRRQIDEAPRLYAAVRGDSAALRALHAHFLIDKQFSNRRYFDIGTKDGLRLQISTASGHGIQVVVNRGDYEPRAITVGELRHIGLGDLQTLEQFFIDARKAFERSRS